MPRERQETDRASFLRSLERAHSTVAILEAACWDLHVAAAADLLEACTAIERAARTIKGEDEDEK